MCGILQIGDDGKTGMLGTLINDAVFDFNRSDKVIYSG